MKNLFLLVFFLMGVSLFARSYPALLPFPQQVTWKSTDFLSDNVSLVTPESEKEILIRWLEENKVAIVTDAGKKIIVELKSDLENIPVNREEAYRLTVEAKQIKIEAVSDRGIYWAVQTLRQLTFRQGKKLRVKGCEITDWPAFRIRGVMQDVGRSYISMEELKDEIARLSRYKINVFHWHLTENQAWRLESKLFPMLNDSINMTRMPGKFYTVEEARELVEFCKQHRVLLIPEIDMPGHSAAFVRTFRHDMQSREGMIILKLLIDEICEIFSGVPYIHAGTDEVQFTNPDFVPEMVRHIRSKGKKVIAWTPGWNYNIGEIDMMQMWSSRGEPRPGIPVIDSRLHYVNHYDAFADIVALFNSNVAGQDRGSPDYAGAVIGVWHDRLVRPERNMILENGFYPALLTLAERTWRGGGKEYFYTKGSLLDPEGSEGYRAFVDFEDRLLWHKKHAFEDVPFAYVKQTNVRWRITDPFPNEGELTKSFPPEQIVAEKYEYNGKIYNSHAAIGAGIYLRHVWGNIVPSFYSYPLPNHTAYARTRVYSPQDQQVGLWVCTQNYSRSEKDLPPLPGKWDYKESRIWINGNVIEPPAWTAVHTEPSNEVPLGNENFEARPPLLVYLHKGWNDVLLKLPIGLFSIPEVRLQKWMFTFVFVTPDGKEAVDGLIYSSDID